MKTPAQRIRITNDSIIRVFLIALCVWGLFYIRDIILVIISSIVIASFMHAAARRLTRLRIHRTLAIVLLYIAVVGAIVGLFYLFVPILLHESSNLLSMLSKYIAPTKVLNQWSNNTFSDAQTFVSNISSQGSFFDIVTNARTVLANISGNFIQGIGTTFGGFFNIILIIIISFYLSVDEHGIEKFLGIVTPLRHEEYVISLWKRTQRKIALWVKGQMVLGLIVGVFIYILLALFHIKYALILALFAAFFELIPFGLFLASIPAISFAFLDGGITLAFTVVGIFIAAQLFEAYVFQPLVIKRVVGISPLVVILSILIGAKLAGFWGIVLAIPVVVALLEYMNDVEQDKVELRAGNSSN